MNFHELGVLSHCSVPMSIFFLNGSLFQCAVDDGSSSCCCWADSERAAAFLGLESEEYLLEDSPENFGRCKAGKGQSYSSTVGHLNQLLEQHGRIVVKNYGSIFDSSCQDLTFSVNSDRLISSSDEDVLRSLITNAFFSTSWVC